MMHQPKLRAFAAYVVCFLFLTTLASPLIAAGSASATSPVPVRIAICPSVQCSYGADDGILAELAAAALLALADSAQYEVVPLEAVPGPERILRVALQDVGGSAGARPMRVTLSAELQNGASGERICAAEVVSTGSAAPARMPSPEAVARAALSSGVQAVVAQVTKAAEIRGIVIGVVQPNRVRVNLGRAAGIKAGTELAIYHNGQYVATAEAHALRRQECKCIITDIKEGIAIQPGDEVRVVSIPAKAPKKARGKGKKSALITGIVVMAGLGLLVGLNSWGGHTVPLTNVADPLDVTKTTIIADGSDSVGITAIVTYADGNPVRNDTQIMFRITQGRGELDSTGTQVLVGTAQGVATTTLTTVDETSPPIVVTAIPRKGTSGSTPPITVEAPTE